MKYVRNYYIKLLLFALLAGVVVQLSCKKTEGYNTIVSTDKTKPGIVTNVKVVNFSGGAYITYSLPSSTNILYVQADYYINNTATRQTKSSYYSDSITVSGFAKNQDYKVVLHTVSRAQVMSDSVVVTVHPDTPAYLLVYKSLLLTNDFGGMNINALNQTNSNVGIVTIAPDPTTKKMEIINQNYTNVDTISYSLRGYDTIPKLFGVYVTDQWGNLSDTILTTIKPLYEVQMNKSLFKAYVMPSDVKQYDDYHGIQNLWNVSITEPDYNTQQPISPLVWPAWCTFDMGQSAKLSRYNMVGRMGDQNQFLWGFGNPQTWVIWGRNDIPVDETMPSDPLTLPPLGGKTPNGWINMGLYTAPQKPSGLPNPQYTTADANFWNAGFGFNFSLSLPKVRYIRFECLSNMDQTNNYFHMNELTFWGDTR